MQVSIPEFFFGKGADYGKIYRVSENREGTGLVSNDPDMSLYFEEVTPDLDSLSPGARRIYDSGHLIIEGVFGGDVDISNAGWSSTGKRKEVMDEQAKRFIENTLAKHGHISPSYQTAIRLRVQMPIYVARQWFKHKIGSSENELSRRYTNEAPVTHKSLNLYYAPKRKTQGVGERMEPEVEQYWQEEFDRVDTYIADFYDRAIKAGMAPQLARKKLTMDTMTEVTQTVSFQWAVHFYKLRFSPHAQEEIRDYAELLGAWMKVLYPVAWDAYTGLPQLTEKERDGLGEKLYNWLYETGYLNGDKYWAAPAWKNMDQEDREQIIAGAEELFFKGYKREFE